MPYRAPALLLVALAGAIAVIGLVLIGIDVYAARQRGPRWKRRLLGAGLAVLGVFGAWSARPRPTPPSSTPICYAPMPMPCPTPSIQSLEQQVSTLARLLDEGRIDPNVARKALAAAETALAEASTREVLDSLSTAERSRAGALIQAARTRIDQLKTRLDANPPAPAKPAASLEESPDWKVITDAWDFARRLSGSSTTKQRSASEAKFKAANEAAGRLVASGVLSYAEAALLASEAEKMARDIRTEPPSDGGVTCYTMAPVSWPDYQGLDRLKQRLPLLEELLASKKINKPVLDKVLGTIQRDLASLDDLLADKKYVTGDKRAEVQRTREAVKAQVERLQGLIEGAPQSQAPKPEAR
ncbi:MAG TPA: hypothetical protein PK280_02710 [Planctomycetota bacterium]|nr:hypothetical protein [Planctomycetota bacterium]